MDQEFGDGSGGWGMDWGFGDGSGGSGGWIWGLGMDQGALGVTSGVSPSGSSKSLQAAPHRTGQAQLPIPALCRLSIASCPRACIKCNRIFSQDGLALGRRVAAWILDGGQLGKELK